jgi:hypothetical protein
MNHPTAGEPISEAFASIDEAAVPSAGADQAAEQGR